MRVIDNHSPGHTAQNARRRTAKKSATPRKKKKNTEFIRRMNRRMTLVGVVVCLCLAALLVRIGYFKYALGDEYERKAVMQLIVGKNSIEKEINPLRGYILDRNKQPLAVSNRVYNVILDVSVLDTVKPTKEEDPKTITLTTLSQVLGIPLSELEALFAKDAEGKLVKPTNYHILARKVSRETAMLIKDLKCVHLEDDTQRKYIDPFFAPQTIGFIRGDSMWGLESQYNTELTGEQGRIFRTYDQESNPVTEDIPSQDGYTLVTTLDAGIQRIAQQVLDDTVKKIECQYAGMLVMKPYTGEILAMAQWSSFSLADPGNPEFFSDKRVANLWEALSAEEQLNQMYKMWGNYHISHTFEPGSIFKPVVVSAALEENIIDPSTASFFCGGKIQVYDTEIPCWYKYGHGSQNVTEVLANSCNVAMIDIIQKLGRDLFFEYRNDFGYGERTDIDLPGEASVSSPSVMYTLSQLNPVELATSAMGQGFNNTAVQAITAFSAVINGGYLMKPYIVSQIVDAHGSVVKENTPTVVRKVISSTTSDYMRYALEKVVSPTGTGKAAMIEGYTIGGKTGTAQQGARDLNQITASFMAFTPVDDPEYIVLAIIDKPTNSELTSSTSVSPMIYQMLNEIFQYKNVRPGDNTSEFAALRDNFNDRSVLSDYSGMQLVEVTHLLNNLEIDYQVVGSGTVVSHHIPAAGQPAPKEAPLFIYMDPESQHDEDMTTVPDVVGLRMEEGENFIRESHLTPITFLDKEDNTNGASGGDPVTYNPVSGGDSTAAENATEETSRYVVYKQFPAPGAKIQKGTEVKLKVKQG